MPRSILMGFSTDSVYQLLTEPLQQALTSFGVSAQCGQVPGAFCDGRFNLQVRGKKIAGSAQVWRANVARRAGRREGYVLAHASLFVCVDKWAITEAVNRFYTLVDDERRFTPDALTSVEDCLSVTAEQVPEVTVNSLRCYIIDTLQSYLNVDSVI